MIEKLRNAVEEMKRITKSDYATASIHMGSDHRLTFNVYTQLTGCLSGNDLDQLIQYSADSCGPKSLLDKAAQLRKQADDLVAKAQQQQQTQESQ